MITEASGNGRVDYITQEGFGILVACLRSNKQATLLKDIRQAALEVSIRFWQADPTSTNQDYSKAHDRRNQGLWRHQNNLRNNQ